MNKTLKSIDLSLKKLVEKQSQETKPQYICLIPAAFENLQIHSLVKKEPITEGEGRTEKAEPWSEILLINILLLLDYTSLFLTVVGKVHRSSTWVKVQIRIIKYYSSKSKSTAFSILLEWKYKSTQFFMYLNKKVLIDRFILQFYIDYFISFYISTYFYNHTVQNTWVFPKITTIESRYIFCWYGLRWWEWCSNVHCEAYTAMYLRENRFHHLIFTSKKKVF